MADVFLDSRLNDYLSEHSWAEVNSSDSARALLIQDFLNEKLVVLNSVETHEIDFDFIQTVRFPQTWEMKKFQFKPLLAACRSGKSSELSSRVLEQGFAGNQGAFEYFLAQLAIIERLADSLLDRLLGGLLVDTKIMVTRFSETRMENLHYDMDQDCDDHEAFRLYINLDSSPRIWSTSYQLTQLLRCGGRRLLDGINPAERGEVILKRAVSRAYGGWNQRATERRSPRHNIYFDPGDVWIVDGRTVSHQVLSGHRVLSIYAKIPHAGNNLAPSFSEKLRTSFADGMSVPIGEETAEVNYFAPAAITGSANLREEWSDVFGRTRTGRIRRFDDAGLRS